MAGRYIIDAGVGVRYYRLPIEALRGLLDNPGRWLSLCKAIMCSDCKSHQELNDTYGWHFNYTDKKDLVERIKRFKNEGADFIAGLGERGSTGTVCFTIEVDMFWGYNNDFCAGKLKEWDWLILLWWIALHTIDGRRKGNTAIHNTTNSDVFRRAAGFSNWADYKAYKWNGDEKMLKYISNPSRYAARLREDLMEKYHKTFHAYSEKGRRGWCFMLAEIPRQQAMDMMVEHMANRGGTKQQFRKELADMKEKARAKLRAKQNAADFVPT